MDFKDTFFSQKLTINCNGRILDLTSPLVMGILNFTPDSFYDGGRLINKDDIIRKAEQLLEEGADIIDIGAYSSRPGAMEITVNEETERLHTVLSALRKRYHDIIISVDTFRADAASYAINEFGIDIINDISAGMLDDNMIPLVVEKKVPYIMMHMPGNPQTMQKHANYEDVTRELLSFFAERITVARQSGIHDIIIDPGFGFGKNAGHNFRLLKDLRLFGAFGCPLLAGLSRKSLIYKSLNITPEEALNGTVVLNTLALNNGACILRVHDVKEAREAVRLYTLYTNA